MQKILNTILIAAVLISGIVVGGLVKENAERKVIFDEMYETLKINNEVITNLVETYDVDLQNRQNIKDAIGILNANQAEFVKALNTVLDNKSKEKVE